MKLLQKLYVALALLSAGSFTYTYDEDLVQQEIQEEVDKIQQQTTSLDEQIDQELSDIFHRFFDKNDKTPFTVIINKIVAMLKLKKESLQGAQYYKCHEIIKTFEANKHNRTFASWARIIVTTNDDLQQLMSEQTRNYINSISNAAKIQALMVKLQQQ